MARYVIFLIASLLIVACNDASNRTANLQQIINRQLYIPTTDIAWQNGGVDTIIELSSTRHKIVAYFDDSGCSPCRIKELNCWNPLIRDAQEQRLLLEFIFIVKSDTSNHEISQALAITNLRAAVMFDPEGAFEAANLLPQASNLHYFLLDTNNCIVKFGNPANHPELWQQYKELIGNAATSSLKLSL